MITRELNLNLIVLHSLKNCCKSKIRDYTDNVKVRIGPISNKHIRFLDRDVKEIYFKYRTLLNFTRCQNSTIKYIMGPKL